MDICLGDVQECVKYAWGRGGGGEKGWLKGVNIIKECPELIKRKYSTA